MSTSVDDGDDLNGSGGDVEGQFSRRLSIANLCKRAEKHEV
jgi:hypothetical protein